MKKTLLWLIIATVCISMVVSFSIAGCKEEAAEETVEAGEEVVKEKGTIAFVPQSGFAGDSSVAFYWDAHDTVIEYGYEFVMGDPNFDAVKQVEIIEDFIAEGIVDGIIFQPIDAKLGVSAVEKANEAGIPVALFDLGVVDGEVIISVKTNNENEGALAAEKLVNELEKKYGESKGLVLEIGGPLTCSCAQARTTGFHEVIDKYPNIEVIHKPCDWVPANAEEAARDFLSANTEADGLFTHSDYYATAIESVLSLIDRKVKVGEENHLVWVSIDGFPVALRLIKEGVMDSTSNVGMDIIAGLAAKLLIENIAEGKVVKPGDDIIATEEMEGVESIEITETNIGPLIKISSVLIDSSNVDDPSLWANREYESDVEEENE